MTKIPLGRLLIILLLLTVQGHAESPPFTRRFFRPPGLKKTVPRLDKTKADCQKALNLVKVTASDQFGFTGLTDAGAARMKIAQEDFKITTTNGNQLFQNMNGVFELDYLTMATRQNAMHAGGPGGAKSGHLNWLLNPTNNWKKQLNELTAVFEIFGGQTEEGLKKGREMINTFNTIVHARFGVLDEFSNANPQVSGSLLSYLNAGERSYTIAGKEYLAATRSVFMTGNATRAQMLKDYDDRGLKTGAATMNRNVHKSWVVNWGHEDSREELAEMDRQNRKLRHLRSVEMYGSAEESAAATAALQRLEAKDIDWEIIEAFAQHAFVPSEELEAAVRDLALAMHKEMNNLVRESERAHKADPIAHPLIVTPSAEWTYRFYIDVLKDISFSAALDYLRMHTWAEVKALNKPIILNPLSLWRAMYMATTVGPGINRYNPRTLKVEFNLVPDEHGILGRIAEHKYKEEMRTQLEADEITFMSTEQNTFNESMLNVLTEMAKESKKVADLLEMVKSPNVLLESQDFEVGVYKWRSLNP